MPNIRLSNGLSMAYQSKGTGQVLVLLHPIGSGACFWEPMMEHLQEDFRCIAIDLRGHGDSDLSLRRFTLDELADDVIEFLRAQEISDAVLVGCSYGGMVGQGVLLRAPELFSGAVLTGTTHMQTEQTRAFLLQRAADTAKGMAPLAEATMERWFAPQFFGENPGAKAEVESWLFGIDPVAFAWSWEAIAGCYYGDLLAEIDLPTLLIKGEHDPGGANMPRMAELMKGRLEEVATLGHMAPYEGPAIIGDMIRDFIKTEVNA